MPEPPAVPSIDSAESAEDKEYRRRMTAARQGKASTILTSYTEDTGFGSSKQSLGGK